VLILDEPTDGLDPNQKQEVRSLIRRMGEKKAIIFSTHILEEVEAACSRAVIIDRGRIVANGTPAELKRRSDSAGTVLLKVRGMAGPTLTQKLSSAGTVGKTTIVREEQGVLVARVQPKANQVNGELARNIAEVALKEGWKLEELHTEEGRLDEVFRSITLPDTVGGKEKNEQKEQTK
jgi:ABC-2 type transport system ATP-binding protein